MGNESTRQAAPPAIDLETGFEPPTPVHVEPAPVVAAPPRPFVPPPHVEPAAPVRLEDRDAPPQVEPVGPLVRRPPQEAPEGGAPWFQLAGAGTGSVALCFALFKLAGMRDVFARGTANTMELAAILFGFAALGLLLVAGIGFVSDPRSWRDEPEPGAAGKEGSSTASPSSPTQARTEGPRRGRSSNLTRVADSMSMAAKVIAVPSVVLIAGAIVTMPRGDAEFLHVVFIAFFVLALGLAGLLAFLGALFRPER